MAKHIVVSGFLPDVLQVRAPRCFVMLCLAVIGFMLGIALVGEAYGKEQKVIIGWRLPGTVVHTKDGDTLVVSLSPSDFRRVEDIRVYGVNAPESRKPPAKCVKEKRLGLIAKAWAKQRLPEGATVTVWVHAKTARPTSNMDAITDKYGRLVSDIVLPDGSDYGRALVKSGNATAYFGTGPKWNWCK
jgi:endonuclease YncB( thermonuclease family)